jgi:PilZ domain
MTYTLGKVAPGTRGPSGADNKIAIDTTLALVSNDAHLTEILQRISGEMHVPVSRFEDPAAAREELGRRCYGGIIIDCDESPAARALLASIRKLSANRVSPIMAVLNGGTNSSDARDMGAGVILDKPVTPDAARRALRELRALNSPHQRRFPRYRVKLPAYLSFGNTLDRLATMVNLSEGGIGVTTYEPVPMDEIVRVAFQLPSGPQLRVLGEVAWCDAHGNAGVRFLSINDAALAQLRTWMERNPDTRM